jgi:LEA14-like dessication related protein
MRLFTPVVLLASLLVLPACDSMQKALMQMEKPSVAVRGVQADRGGIEGPSLTFDLEIANPYSFDLPLTGVDYALTTNNTPLLTGVGDVKGAIPAKGMQTVPLKITVPYRQLLSALGGVRPGKPIPYNATLNVGFDAPTIGRITVPTTRAGELPVPAVPGF